jgi:hypothetical protein
VYTFACPSCGQWLRGDSARAGWLVQCPNCAHEFEIPEPPDQVVSLPDLEDDSQNSLSPDAGDEPAAAAPETGVDTDEPGSAEIAGGAPLPNRKARFFRRLAVLATRHARRDQAAEGEAGRRRSSRWGILLAVLVCGATVTAAVCIVMLSRHGVAWLERLPSPPEKTRTSESAVQQAAKGDVDRTAPDAPSPAPLPVAMADESRTVGDPFAAAPVEEETEEDAFRAIGLFETDRILAEERRKENPFGMGFGSMGGMSGGLTPGGGMMGPGMSMPGASRRRPGAPGGGRGSVPATKPPTARAGFQGPLTVERLERSHDFVEAYPRSALCRIVRESLVADTILLLKLGGGDTDPAMVRALCLAALTNAHDALGQDLWSAESLDRAVELLRSMAGLAAPRPELWGALCAGGLADLTAAVVRESSMKNTDIVELCSQVVPHLPDGPVARDLRLRFLRAVVDAYRYGEGGGRMSAFQAQAACRVVSTALDECIQAGEGAEHADLVYDALCAAHTRAPDAALALMRKAAESLAGEHAARRAARKALYWDRDAAMRLRVALRLRVEALHQKALPQALADIDPQALCEAEGLPFPVKAPTIPAARIDEAIAARVTEAVRAEFPLSRLDDIRHAADRKYAPYKTGEEITVALLAGRMGGRKVTGRFHARYPSHVRIGDRTILKTDIAPLDRIRLDPEQCREHWEQEVKANSEAYKDRREEFRQRKEQELRTIAYTNAGYVLRNGEWISPVAVFDKALARRREEVADALRATIMKEVFEKEGFALVNGEWVAVDPDRKR